MDKVEKQINKPVKKPTNPSSKKASTKTTQKSASKKAPTKAIDTAKKLVLTEEEKKLINKKANKLISDLAVATGQMKSKAEKEAVRTILKELELCAKKLESQFLDDIVFIVRTSLNIVINSKKLAKEKKDEQN